jgi:hypothetical protein
VVTNNYPGTVTANAFVGDGSALTGINATTVDDNSVTSTKILDGTIEDADISATAAIPFSKLNITYGDITSLGIPGTDTDTQYDAGTGITLTGTTFSIDNTVVTNNYPGSVMANAFLGDGSQLTNVNASTVDNNSVTSAKIADGTIEDADISATAAIPFSKLNISKADLGVFASQIDAAGLVVNSSSSANINHTPGTGVYTLSYPSASFSSPMITATLENPGFITATYSGGGNFTITTYDITGTPTDNDFQVMVVE